MKQYFIIISLALLFSVTTLAQNGYNLLFKTSIKEVPEFVKTVSPSFSRLVCNDSSSFYFHVKGKKNPVKEGEVYGSRVFHHSFILFFDRDKQYSGYALPTSRKKHLYISDTIRHQAWVLTDSFKHIQGYKCRMAYQFMKNKFTNGGIEYFKHDSVFAWYTDQINLPFGPLYYYGLPGLILEVYDQYMQGRLIECIKIQKEPVHIQIPENITIIPAEEFRKRKK